MAHEMLEQCQIGNHAQNPNQIQGHNKEDKPIKMFRCLSLKKL